MTRIAQTYPQLALQLAATEWSSTQLASVRAAHDLAASLFVAAARGSGKPFIDHLIGTASGVLLGGGDADAVAAALLHAAYDAGDFGDGRTGPRPAHRRAIRGAVGADAEDLVFRYDQLGWSPAVAAHAMANVQSASTPERSVLLMRVANEVDEVLDGGAALAGKDHLPEHDPVVHRSLVALAERLATPDFAQLTRDVLLAPPRSFPSELIVGAIGSTPRMPRSGRRRWRVWLVDIGASACRVVVQRLPPGVKRVLRRFRGVERPLTSWFAPDDAANVRR